jgi:diguanylate cyclase (GGDEF)-like protein
VRRFIVEAGGRECVRTVGIGTIGQHLAIRRWAIWSARKPARVVILSVDAIAFVAAVVAVVTSPMRPSLSLAPLVICMIVAVEGARRVERVRRSTGSLHKDLQAVWSLTAAIVLPPGLAVLAAVVAFAWWRVRAGRCRVYAWVFSSAMVTIAVLAAGDAYRLVGELVRRSAVPSELAVPLAVLAAAVLYEIVDVLLCGVTILLMTPGVGRAGTFGTRTTVATDTAALTFGGLVAMLYLYNPWAVLLALPAVVLLQRVLLIGQLEHAAHTDPKTGLAAIGWWSERASAELARVKARGGRLAVLVVDLDHFKRINDEHGHLVGDDALRAVAEVVREAVGEHSVVGRFGGEEFVIALPGAEAARAIGLADRLREQVAHLQVLPADGGGEVYTLTASVGVAIHPYHGDTLDDLIRAADGAMYAAKAAGRDRTEVATVRFRASANDHNGRPREAGQAPSRRDARTGT